MRSVDFILCVGPGLRAARSGREAGGGPEPGGSQSSRGGEAAGADLQLPAELAASWSWSKDGRPSCEWPGVPHRARALSRAFAHVRGLPAASQSASLDSQAGRVPQGSRSCRGRHRGDCPGLQTGDRGPER